MQGDPAGAEQRRALRAAAAHGAEGQWRVLVAAMLWGTTGASQAFAPVGATPLSVGAVRMAVGGGILLAYALARRQFRMGARWRPRTLLLGAALMALYQVGFFSGVALTGVAVGTVVAIGSAPVFAGLIALVVDRRRPPARWWLATLLAITGCVLLLAVGATIQVNPMGVGLACLAGFSYAAYTVAMASAVVDHAPEMINAVVFCGAALLLSPLLVTADPGWLVSPRGMVVALWLGLMATAVAYILYVRALTTVAAHTAVTLALMEPVTATFLGIVVLGERLTPTAALGMGLVIAGLAVITRRQPLSSSHSSDSP